MAITAAKRFTMLWSGTKNTTVSAYPGRVDSGRATRGLPFHLCPRMCCPAQALNFLSTAITPHLKRTAIAPHLLGPASLCRESIGVIARPLQHGPELRKSSDQIRGRID